MSKQTSKIHKTAIIGKKVHLGKNVQVGPYAVIEGEVTIGDGTVIEAGAHIIHKTTLGKNCHVYQGAVIGQVPQDLKYKGEKTQIIIGDNNQFREFVTVNLGTQESGLTRIGNNNLFMAYSHVAHDCTVGNDNIFANVATLAGFVNVQNKIVIGGLTAIHQYCRVGEHAIIGGCSKVVQDIPPFSMSDGHPTTIKGLNLIGLKRGNFSKDEIAALKKAFQILFFKGHASSHAKELIRGERLDSFSAVKRLLAFVETTKRGIAR